MNKDADGECRAAKSLTPAQRAVVEDCLNNPHAPTDTEHATSVSPDADPTESVDTQESQTQDVDATQQDSPRGQLRIMHPARDVPLIVGPVISSAESLVTKDTGYEMRDRFGTANWKSSSSSERPPSSLPDNEFTVDPTAGLLCESPEPDGSPLINLYELPDVYQEWRLDTQEYGAVYKLPPGHAVIILSGVTTVQGPAVQLVLLARHDKTESRQQLQNALAQSTEQVFDALDDLIDTAENNPEIPGSKAARATSN